MVVCTLPHFSPLKLGSFAVLSKTFFLGKNRETIIVQNVFSLGNYAKPSQVKNQKHFFLGSVVKLLPIKNIISPGEIHIVLTRPTKNGWRQMLIVIGPQMTSAGTSLRYTCSPGSRMSSCVQVITNSSTLRRR